MRLWSLHPRYLDRQGLLACWREGLLAQAVLLGETRGYRSHPQLQRFRETEEPLSAIGSYLAGVREEAVDRGYRFDGSRIRAGDSSAVGARAGGPLMEVTDGQLAYERAHLAAKLALRDPDRLAILPEAPEPHGIFRVTEGPVASWERPGESGSESGSESDGSPRA